MTTNQHSVLGVHATTASDAPADLIDALDNLTNAATFKNFVVHRFVKNSGSADFFYGCFDCNFDKAKCSLGFGMKLA